MFSLTCDIFATVLFANGGSIINIGNILEQTVTAGGCENHVR